MASNRKKASKLLLGSLLGIVGSVASVASANAYGPERPTYTNEHPASKAVFNSIINNAAVGDERDFVRIVEVHSDGKKDAYTNQIHVSSGKTYEVYIYYHNDASSTYNDKAHDYVGVARESRVSSSFPESIKKGQSAEVYAAISSTTTSIPKVWDEATLIADEDVVFAFIPASAKIYNDWGANGSILSTSLFTNTGTFIGLNNLNGLILGCDEYSGQVVYRIKTLTPVTPTPTPEPEPEPEPIPGYDVSKKVRVDGSNDWQDSVTIKPGDTVEYKLTFKNTGNTLEKEVKLFDILDTGNGMEYVEGSLSVTRSVEGDSTSGGAIAPIEPDVAFFTEDGMLIGDVRAGETITATYKVKFTGENNEKCKISTLYNNARVSGKVEGSDVTVVRDSAEVKVDRTSEDCSTPTPTPTPTPSELPDTGPLEIVMAIVVVLGIGGGAYYLYRTRKTLKTVEDTAAGKDIAAKSDKDSSQKPDNMVK